MAKALNITAEGVVISDARLPDLPIIYANQGFERLTGYRIDQVLGRNCRFLQGADTDPETVRQIRQALSEGTNCRVDILNYRKDGTPFWNRLSITPLRDDSGITHFVGVQFDITELKETKSRLEKANQGLQRFHEEMSAQLEQARQAQRAVLQTDLPASPYFDAAVRLVPFSEIGGDFYDVFRINEQTFGFMIADVTGHGIPAALLTFMSAEAFRNSAPGRTSSAAVLDETNRRLLNKMPFGSYASMFYMIYQIETRELVYSQAGHPPALLLRPSGEVMLLSTQGALVGIFPPEQAHWEEAKVTLQVGDKVIMYTDAVLETDDRRSWEEEIDRLLRLVRRNRGLAIDDLLSLIYRGDNNSPPSYTDDVTLLGFEVRQ